MKRIFQMCLIACAVFSTNSFAEQSYACKVMLEQGSAMFCQEGAQTVASAPTNKPEVEVALKSKDRTFACSSMLERNSGMFCNEEGGLIGSAIASE